MMRIAPSTRSRVADMMSPYSSLTPQSTPGCTAPSGPWRARTAAGRLVPRRPPHPPSRPPARGGVPRCGGSVRCFLVAEGDRVREGDRAGATLEQALEGVLVEDPRTQRHGLL